MSREELEAEAASPKTTPARLQELANNYPKLRPLIAMNPTAYPALVKWLADLNDPAINVALAQRTAASSSSRGGPRRVSVMGRSDEASLPAAAALPIASEPVRVGEPIAEPSQPSTQTGELGVTEKPANPNKTPLIIVGVLLATAFCCALPPPAWARSTTTCSAGRPRTTCLRCPSCWARSGASAW